MAAHEIATATGTSPNPDLRRRNVPGPEKDGREVKRNIPLEADEKKKQAPRKVL